MLASKLEGTELASFDASAHPPWPLAPGKPLCAFVRKAKGVRVAHGIEAGNASSYLLLEHGL